MVLKDICTGVNVHDFFVNDRCVAWKWTPLVMETFRSFRNDSVSIETRYLLSVKSLEISRTCCNVDVLRHESDKVGLVIRSLDRSDGGVWKIQTWNLICEPDNADTYYNEIKLYRDLCCPDRPRSLLIFVNPYGGRRRAEAIYYSSVRPIFDLAGIRSKVILTTHKNHCQKYILNEDLSPYDGVVSVGGDGLFSELLQGLLYRTRKDAKMPLYDAHKPFTTELTPRLKIGLIPAGSTNAVIRSLHGTEDVETAAIHIALGHNVGVDVLGVHDSSTKAFLRYTVSLLGYGFHGDILYPSERMRFLGPRRYDIAGAWRWLKFSSYRVRIAYLPSTDSTPMDSNTCEAMCPICMKDIECEKAGNSSLAIDHAHQSPDLIEPPSLTHSHLPDYPLGNAWGEPGEVAASSMDDDLLTEVSESRDLVRNSENEDVELPGGWRVTSGEFVAVNAFLISCRCAKSPLGPAPSAHLGDGYLDLILVRRCSRWKYLSYLVQLTNKRKDRSTQHLRMPFVEAHRVKAFRLQSLDNHGDPISNEKILPQKVSVWNVDGEILTYPNVICCVHRQLIRLYGRGPEV
ncbi:unnamed protein product [Hymenolepis diminuta]|uniref:DAGKc domain-containing protein n=2 Tax=Hymenolepis diminuta TaxID=6216 RepID=A0A564Z0P4_HYMDI|nr:unnamed protein product [Hymenolepis diminuta]